NILEETDKIDAIRENVNYFLDAQGVASFYYDEIGIPTSNMTADPKLDSASELLQDFMKKDKTVFTYYSYEPAGFDAESWKITVEYIQKGDRDHKALIQSFDEAFKRFAGSLNP